MKILAKNGHEVTVIAPYKEKNPPQNYTSIELTGLIDELNKNVVDYYTTGMDNPFLSMIIYGMVAGFMTNTTITHPVFQQFLIDNKNVKYDLIIYSFFMSEALSFLPWYFNAPSIVYSPIDSCFMTYYWTAQPAPMSYVPDFYAPYPSKMSFIQRTKNFLITTVNQLNYHYIAMSLQSKILKENFPDAPPLETLVPKSSLIFVNSDDGIRFASPKVPNVIDIGGFHIKPPEKLPNDLQDLLDNHPHGIIYFSMGSNLKSKDMPEKLRNVLLKAFSNRKEIILWKWESENLPGKPDNVIIRKWFPQTSILAHKNVKLFITHGGIFSSIETIYFGKPILALPVLIDQQMNARRAESNGYAKVIKFIDINEDNFEPALQEMLHVEYRERANLRQIIMRDKLNTAEEKVVFYTNYVLRHKGDLQHLQVEGARMPWYQSYMIDVILFCITVLICVLAIMIKLLKYLCRKIKNIFIKEKKD